MKEYGQNVQKLLEYILTIEDREKRTKYAFLMVELMRQVHPNMRDNGDYSNKLWDDLYILSNFQLDVDSPFPPPSPDAVGKPPKIVPYNVHKLKYRHYGRNVELVILKAIAEQDPENKKTMVAYIGKLMKGFYQTWNREVVDDVVIWEHLREMSENLLAKTIEEVAGSGALGFSRGKARPNTYSADQERTPTRSATGGFRSNNGGATGERRSNSYGGQNDRNSSDRNRNPSNNRDNRNNNLNNRNTGRKY